MGKSCQSAERLQEGDYSQGIDLCIGMPVINRQVTDKIEYCERSNMRVIKYGLRLSLPEKE